MCKSCRVRFVRKLNECWVNVEYLVCAALRVALKGRILKQEKRQGDEMKKKKSQEDSTFNVINP